MEEKFSFAIELKNTLRLLGKRINTRFLEENMIVSTEQFAILEMISQTDEFIQSDLANLIGKDKSAILRQVDVLQQNKLIVRVNDPVDRRKKFIICTKPGEEVLEKGKKIVDEILENLTKGIPQDELDTFRAVLTKMRANGEV